MTPSEPTPGSPAATAPPSAAASQPRPAEQRIAFVGLLETKQCSSCGTLTPGPPGTSSYRWRRHPISRALLCGPCGCRAVQQRFTTTPPSLEAPASEEPLPAKRRRTAPVRPGMLSTDHEEADRAGSAERQQALEQGQPIGGPQLGQAPQAERAQQQQQLQAGEQAQAQQAQQAQQSAREELRCTACGSRRAGPPRTTSYNWRRHPVTRLLLCGPCGAKMRKLGWGSVGGAGEGQPEHQPGTPRPATTQVDAIGALLNLANGAAAAAAAGGPGAARSGTRPVRRAAGDPRQPPPTEHGQLVVAGAGGAGAAAARRPEGAPPRRRGRPPKKQRMQLGGVMNHQLNAVSAQRQAAASVPAQRGGRRPAAQRPVKGATVELQARAGSQVPSAAPQALEQAPAGQQQRQQAPPSERQGWQAGWQEGWQAGWQAAMRQVESGGALPWVKGEHVAAGEQVEVPGTQPSCGGVGEEGHDAVLRQLMTAQLADPEAEAQGLTIELVSTHQRQFEGLSREQKRARAGPLMELLQAKQYAKLAKFLEGLAH